MEGRSQGQGAADRSPVPLPSGPMTTALQAHGITTNSGDFFQVGGNVNIQHHYYRPLGATIDILNILRLVPNLRKFHLDVLSKATPGTGIWLLRAKNFLLWLDPSGNLKLMWGTGIPGAGKTVMASIVINHLEARAAGAGGSICVAYIYFRYSNAAEQTLRNVFEILVKQTVERHPHCQSFAEWAYARHTREGTRPTEAELLELLRHFTETTVTTFYIIDALDEAPEMMQVDLVAALASLNAKLFITSRQLKSVEARAPGVHSFPIVAQDNDLELHIARGISRSRDFRDLLEEADPSFKDEVIASLKKNSGGMFLHASLQLEAICRCTSTQDAVDTLKEFPAEVDGAYRHTWKRICSQSFKNAFLAKTVLVWVLHSARPMNMEELRQAVATSPTTYKFEPKRRVSASTLITLCCGLIAMEEETKVVRLVHYTAKETLQELLHDAFPHPHSLIATVCMTHLTKCGFQNTTIDSEEEFTAALHNDPLLAYASDTWATHVRKSLDDDAKINLPTASFISACTAFPSFINPNRSACLDILSPLHILAIYHLPFSLIAYSGAQNANATTKRRQSTPLILASWCGHAGLVQDLLTLPNIDINKTDVFGWPAFFYAAFEGHQEIVELLVACPQAQVNQVDRRGWSALTWAAFQGHEGIVSILLARPEIEVNSSGNRGWTALMSAASKGHDHIVHLLFTCPQIQVNMVDSKGWSALMWATYNGHERTAALLLAYPGIQVDIFDNEGCSALALAAKGAHDACAELLLAIPGIQVDPDGDLAGEGFRFGHEESDDDSSSEGSESGFYDAPDFGENDGSAMGIAF